MIIIACISIMAQMSAVLILEGRKIQQEMRSDQQLINNESKEEKQRATLSKKTHEKLKAAREQYKKQLARLIDLLAQADELGRGVEESEVTTSDLRGFLSGLGDIYTTFIDTITGTSGLKERISVLEKNNAQLSMMLQSTMVKLNEQNTIIHQLQNDLNAEKNSNIACIVKATELENEKLLWLDYLNRLQSCANTMREDRAQSEEAGEFVGEMLTEAWQGISPDNMPKS